MRTAAICLLVVLVATPLYAQQSTQNPQPKALFGALRNSEHANPYRKLFQAPQVVNPSPSAWSNAARPRVVCGMLIIPADPALDPKMRITPPQDPNVEYKIRTLEPTVCR